MPGLAATDPVGKRREAEEWCDRFQANTNRWLKSTIATCGADGNPEISYEDVDTSLLPPRPRLYGLVGGGSDRGGLEGAAGNGIGQRPSRAGRRQAPGIPDLKHP